MKKFFARHLMTSDTYTIGETFIENIDADGHATTTDVRTLLLSILGTVDLDTAQTRVADSDRSGTVTTRDARLLLLALTER